MIWSSARRAVFEHPIGANKTVSLDSARLQSVEDSRAAALVIRMIREDRREESCNRQLLWCFRTD